MISAPVAPMERRLDQELNRIRQSLLRMAGLVEEMVARATQALLERNAPLVSEVVRQDREVDRLEIDIDEACHSVLSRKQPAAVDLRFLVAVMKINSDLERIGDSAVNIAHSVEALLSQPPLDSRVELPLLSRRVQEMMRDSLNAFVRRDARLASAVLASDDEVDQLYKQIFRELLTGMIEDPTTVTRALHFLLIAKNFERIADHATNVAEDVIYFVEGRDVRHPSAAEAR
ncbi:MAG TPA: phosphate signaling complex protein PhoU [Thermoanaerobaculia bacterium]|nr:phosphate signaling complex protein PhoU [Thermoanaerobaculia bacterium]